MSDPAEALRTRLREDLRVAMKTRDAALTRALRSLVAVIDNAQAVAATAAPGPKGAANQWVAGSAPFGAADVPRKVMDAAALSALMQGEADKLSGLAADMERLGQSEAAASARAEAAIALRYV